MNNIETMKLALEALETVTKEMLTLRDELAERGGRPQANEFHQRLWDSSHKAYVETAIPTAEALRQAIEQAQQAEPVALAEAQQQDKGLGACPIPRTNDLEIKPNDRRTETSNHYLGKDDSRIIQTGRGAEIHTSSAELGAYSSNPEQYEGVNNSSGLSAPAQPKPVATKWLAEMIMSDCGFSTEYKPLLDRIIGRIELYDRANTPTQPEPIATVISETGDSEVTMSWWHEPALPVGTLLYTFPPVATNDTSQERVDETAKQRHEPCGLECDCTDVCKQDSYKALWEQMCQRCDELDKQLAQQAEPVAELTDDAIYDAAYATFCRGPNTRELFCMMWTCNPPCSIGWDRNELKAFARHIASLYTFPLPRHPLPPQSPCEMTQAEYKMFKLGWLECEAAHGIKGGA